MELTESSDSFDSAEGTEVFIDPILFLALDRKLGDISLRWSSKVVVRDRARWLLLSLERSSSSAAD